MKGYKIYQGPQQVIPHGSSQYRVAPNTRVDEVILRFDEEEQRFYARINHPSQHTQYLFNHDRLGIMLSRGDTGGTINLHHYDSGCGRDKGNVGTHGGHYVKRKFHPRWHGIGESIMRVDDLNEEISLPIIRPSRYAPVCNHGLPNIPYTVIKGLLVSIHDDYTPSISLQPGGCWRPYHTYSNWIPIRISDSIRIRTRGHPPTDTTKIIWTALDQWRYKVEFEDMGPAWSTAIANQDVHVRLTIWDVGSTAIAHGNSRYSHILYRNIGYRDATLSNMLLPADGIVDMRTFAFRPTQQMRNVRHLMDMHGDDSTIIVDDVSLVLQIANNTKNGQLAIPFHIYYDADHTIQLVPA